MQIGLSSESKPFCVFVPQRFAWHLPLTHDCPAGHIAPHLPQLAASLFISLQFGFKKVPQLYFGAHLSCLKKSETPRCVFVESESEFKYR